MIRERGLGWDITDYGEGRFDEMGLFLFTTRNGTLADLNKGRGMLYAEKIMISRDRQLSPMHRHDIKAEDIINRGGGDLVIELFASDPQGGIDRDSEVTVLTDGMAATLAGRRAAAAEAGRERHADARRLARLLGRGRRCLHRRSLDRQRRQDRQRVRAADRPLLRHRGRRGPVHLLVSDYDTHL